MRSIRNHIWALGAACGLAASSGSAWAADKQAVWEGFETTTSSTAACAGVVGAGVGDTRVSIYRPHINSTDTPTYLSFVQVRAALTMENSSESLWPQMQGTGPYYGFAIDARALWYNFKTGTNYTLNIVPHPVTATTSSVTITGTLTNLWGVKGCNIGFTGVYVKRPD